MSTKENKNNHASFLIKVIRRLFFKKYNRSTDEQIKYSLKVIDDIFGLNSIVGKNLSYTDVEEYYIECFDIYNRIQSKDQGMHWKLNFDGLLKDSDIYNISIMIGDMINDYNSHDILELGFGKGFNLKYLNGCNSNLKLYGLDMTEKNILAAKQNIQNADLRSGNFDELIPFDNESIDFIFNVESFCHSTDPKKFFLETNRVLRNNGKLLLVDAFSQKAVNQLSSDEQIAKIVFCKSMACNELLFTHDVVEIASNCGYKHINTFDYSAATALQSIKFEQFANNLCRFKWLLKEGLKRHSNVINLNLNVALLARSLVEIGVFSYNFLLFEKIEHP